MTSLNRRLALFAVLAFLGATLALGLHHHADGGLHPDCSACLVAQQARTSSVSAAAVLAPPRLPVTVLTPVVCRASVVADLHSLPFARAPPRSSS